MISGTLRKPLIGKFKGWAIGEGKKLRKYLTKKTRASNTKHQPRLTGWAPKWGAKRQWSIAKHLSFSKEQHKNRFSNEPVPHQMSTSARLRKRGLGAENRLDTSWRCVRVPASLFTTNSLSDQSVKETIDKLKITAECRNLSLDTSRRPPSTIVLSTVKKFVICLDVVNRTQGDAKKRKNRKKKHFRSTGALQGQLFAPTMIEIEIFDHLSCNIKDNLVQSAPFLKSGCGRRENFTINKLPCDV